MYTLVVINGYELLKKKVKRYLKVIDYVHGFFFINCGATLDMVKCFMKAENWGKIPFFVLDSHRPFNLENATRTNENVLPFSFSHLFVFFQVILIDDNTGQRAIDSFTLIFSQSERQKKRNEKYAVDNDEDDEYVYVPQNDKTNYKNDNDEFDMYINVFNNQVCVPHFSNFFLMFLPFYVGGNTGKTWPYSDEKETAD